MIEIRERRRDGFTPTRAKLEVRRAARWAAIVCLGLAGAAAIVAYIGTHVSRTLLASTYEVRFAVTDATAVVAGQNQVRFKGIPAGTITSVEMHDGQPVLTAKIQKHYGQVYRDARAALRPNTALQDMYLDITDRGTRSAGLATSDQPLPPSQTDAAVHIDDVLNVFRPSVRGQLRALVDNLGNGLEDRGNALRTAFADLVPLLTQARRITQQLDDRAPMTARLIHNARVLTDELARRQRQVRRLVHSTSVTLGAIRQRSPDLDRTLAVLPATIGTLRSSFATTSQVLPSVDHALSALAPVAQRLPAALSDLRELSSKATPALRALRPTVKRLVPLTRAVVPVASDLSSAGAALRPQTGTISHATAALVACKKGVQGFFQWDASLSKFGDSFGPIPRGQLVAGAESAGGLTSSPWEFRPGNCVPGTAIGGRVPRPEDEH
jgi:virulence factor Mce-like protein